MPSLTNSGVSALTGIARVSRRSRIAPDQTMPYYVLGHHELKHQRIQQAIDAFERYMQLEPNNPVVITNLATAHLVMYETQVSSKVAADRAHIDRAIALCEKGLKTDTRNAPLWDALGKAYTYDTELRVANRNRTSSSPSLIDKRLLTNKVNACLKRRTFKRRCQDLAQDRDIGRRQRVSPRAKTIHCPSIAEKNGFLRLLHD